MGQLQKYNIHIMRMPEGEEREKGTEEIFETMMTENFPKLMSDIKPEIQEARKTPSRINVKKPHYILMYHFQITENQR